MAREKTQEEVDAQAAELVLQGAQEVVVAAEAGAPAAFAEQQEEKTRTRFLSMVSSKKQDADPRGYP